MRVCTEAVMDLKYDIGQRLLRFWIGGGRKELFVVLSGVGHL